MVNRKKNRYFPVFYYDFLVSTDGDITASSITRMRISNFRVHKTESNTKLETPKLDSILPKSDWL